MDDGIMAVVNALDAMNAQIAKNTVAVTATNPEAAARRITQAGAQANADIERALAPMKVYANQFSEHDYNLAASQQKWEEAAVVMANWRWTMKVLMVLLIFIIGGIFGSLFTFSAHGTRPW